MLTNTIKNLVGAIVVSGVMVAATVASAEEAKVPETTADHEALAKTYQAKASSYRQEVAWHRSMADGYAKKYPTSKGGIKDARAVNMQKHCEQMVKTAEKLATEAEKAADYHNLRAKELQGK